MSLSITEEGRSLCEDKGREKSERLLYSKGQNGVKDFGLHGDRRGE